MREFALHIFMIPLTASAILSLKSFRPEWPSPYKTFSLILLFFFFLEAFNICWKYWLHHTSLWHYTDEVMWMYNISFMPQYLLFFYFFFQILNRERIKIVIICLSIVFIIFALVNILFIERLHNLNTYTFALASIIILNYCISYFNQLKSAAADIQLFRHPMAWLVTGTFLYHATKYPFILGFKYLAEHNKDLVFAAYNIYLAIGCLFYILFFIAYLCKPPLQK